MTEEFRALADVKRLRVAAVYERRRPRSAGQEGPPGRHLGRDTRPAPRPRAAEDASPRRVRICVLDEADRMLDMGFLPDVTRMHRLLRPTDRRCCSPRRWMVRSANSRSTFPVPVIAGNSFDGPLVTESDHRFVAVDQADRTRVLVRELAADRGLTLVFVRTKRRCRPAGPELETGKASAPRRCTAG